MVSTDKLPDLKLIHRELERCGWQPSRPGPFEGEFVFETPRGDVRSPLRALRSPRGALLLAIDLGAVTLGGREELYPRFLDFSMETRLALELARRIDPGGDLLMLSAGRIDLYGLPEENLQHRALTMSEFEDDILPTLAAKLHGRGDRWQALPNPIEVAQALRGWLAHWERRLASELEVAPEAARQFLWKLILMLQVARKTGKPTAMEAWGLACEKAGDGWRLRYDALRTLSDLERLLEEFDQTFSTALFPRRAAADQPWLAALETATTLEQLRAELLMQAQLRFEAECVAWLFTHVDREQQGWRREIGGLEPVGKRLVAQNWWVVEPLQVDVGRFGLLAALRDLERLAEHWSQRDAYRRGSEGPAGRFLQPDLFFGHPRGVNPRQELDDGVNFLFSQSFRVAGAPPAERYGLGVTLLLKALGVVQRLDWPFFGVDTLDHVWLEGES